MLDISSIYHDPGNCGHVPGIPCAMIRQRGDEAPHVVGVPQNAARIAKMLVVAIEGHGHIFTTRAFNCVRRYSFHELGLNDPAQDR